MTSKSMVKYLNRRSKKDLNVNRIIESYRIEKTIGEGTFGKVKLGIHIPTEEYVAIKILEKDKIQDKEDLDRISREINFLKKFNHPNIIKIYELIENPKNFYIIMEFASCGELFKHIINKKKLPEEEASFLYIQLISGLELIHKNHIVHRDIKPENLLLKDNNILTIIDFGLSNQYKKGEMLSTICGSPCYAPPEMFLGKKYNGLKADLWSSGIVLYVMVCGYLPFEDKDHDKLYKKILNGKFELPEYLSQDCRDLICKLLIVNPNKRINLDDIKRHPFLIKSFNSYHIDEYEEKIKYCEPVIDKMVTMQQFNLKKEDIILNLSQNRHNNITTTYELLLKKYKQNKDLFMSNSNITATTSQQSVSLSSTMSAVISEEDKMKNILRINKDNIDGDLDIQLNKTLGSTFNNTNKGISANVSKTSRETKYRHVKGSLYHNFQKTLDATINSHTPKNIKSKSKNFKNDVSISLDVSKIINKHNIDSNNIIGIPKLIHIDKDLFSLNNKNNNFYYKTDSLNKDYKDNYNPNGNKKYESNRIHYSNKNYSVNTSVTLSNSAFCQSDISSNRGKNKKIICVPGNTLNHINTFKKNKKYYSITLSNSCNSIKNKSIRHYSEYPFAIGEMGILKSFSSKNDYSLKKYLNSFSGYDYITKSNSEAFYSPINKKTLKNNCENNNISKGDNSYYKLINSNKTKSIQKNIKHSSIQKKYESTKTSSNKLKSSNKYASPNQSILNEKKNDYCPSFTDCALIALSDQNSLNSSKKNDCLKKQMSNISQFNLYARTPIPKKSDILISVKKQGNINQNIKHIKRKSIDKEIQSIIRKSTLSSQVSNQKNKKGNNQKHTIINIDITEDIKKSYKLKSPKHAISNKSSQKNLNIQKRQKLKSPSLQKNKEVHTKDVRNVAISQKGKNICKIPKIQFDLSEDSETKNKIITTSNDFALCTTNSTYNEIYEKLMVLCKENCLTLTEIGKLKYICKKDSDNSINIEVSKVGMNTVLKLYHLNGQESITKEMIKKIIIRIGF